MVLKKRGDAILFHDMGQVHKHLKSLNQAAENQELRLPITIGKIIVFLNFYMKVLIQNKHAIYDNICTCFLAFCFCASFLKEISLKSVF